MENNNNNNNSQHSDSLYSYSYLNEENQDRNPNYYERREENSQPVSGAVTTDSGERVYTAGESQPRNDRQFYTTGESQNGGQTYTAGESQSGGQNGSQWNPAAGKKKKPKKSKEKKQHGFGMTVAKCAALEIGRAHV